MTAAPLQAGTHLHQVPGTAEGAARKLNQTVPAAPVPAGHWQISAIGDKWGAFQSWAGPVYWLRLFDSFREASEFVRSAMARMRVVK